MRENDNKDGIRNSICHLIFFGTFTEYFYFMEPK